MLESTQVKLACESVIKRLRTEIFLRKTSRRVRELYRSCVRSNDEDVIVTLETSMRLLSSYLATIYQNKVSADKK
jgi:hypothetical protein